MDIFVCEWCEASLKIFSRIIDNPEFDEPTGLCLDCADDEYALSAFGII
jgi:hypothetical protein